MTAFSGDDFSTVFSVMLSSIFTITMVFNISSALNSPLAASTESVSPATAPQLEKIELSNSSGYVQTPGWDQGAVYRANTSSLMQLIPPSGHVVMVSLQDMALDDDWPVCSGGRVCVSNLKINMQWCLFCSYATKVLGPVVSESALRVDFVSDRGGERAGFRLYYSFHLRSHTLKMTDGKGWNCSVPQWPDFERHFPCNVRKDCVEGEDEANCPYTCPDESPKNDHNCYWYEVPKMKTSWNDASSICRSRGARLVSLNTAAEWRHVKQVLGLRRNTDVNFDVFVGLRYANNFLPPLYRNMFIWQDSRPAYYLLFDHHSYQEECAMLSPIRHRHSWRQVGNGLTLRSTTCKDLKMAALLCEFDKSLDSDFSVYNNHKVYNVIRISRWAKTSRNGQFDQGDTESERGSVENKTEVTYPRLQESLTYDFPTVTCPSGHVTHAFLACYLQSACWVGKEGDACDAPLSPPPPSFLCTNGLQHVPYGLLCDHRLDCMDQSDEDLCVFPPCGQRYFDCGNRQCVREMFKCDGVAHCNNGEDEVRCPAPIFENMTFRTLPPPALVLFDGKGSFRVHRLDAESPDSATSPVCPDTHFQCPDGGYCLPVYVLCNGVNDCPGSEDEDDCDVLSCPGFYRCRQSTVCLHPAHTCDGHVHCPLHDDEMLCHPTCPEVCICYGEAFYCSRPVLAGKYPTLRFLDVSGTNMTMQDMAANFLLAYLNLASCGLTQLRVVSLPNLWTLDVNYNRLTSVTGEMLTGLSRLHHLSLSGNPLWAIFSPGNQSEMVFNFLTTLDLSNVPIRIIDFDMLSQFPKLQILNLSHARIEDVVGEGLHVSVKDLVILDVKGCPLSTFPRDLLNKLDKLDKVYADNYKLCCPIVLPKGFNVLHCYAPADAVSSCEDLLRSTAYRVSLVVFSVLALFGNAASFVFRALSRHKKSRLAFSVFVTHLSVSDFLMGVYLAVVGVADHLYRGSYLWNDVRWRGSAACQAAGFLSLLSSEVSAFLICIITLDRLLVCRFPLGQVRFSRSSAHGVCAGVWALGVGLAALPLLPALGHCDVYGQTGVCLPLPFKGGQDYTFGLMVVLNFALFVLIAVGQKLILASIQANSLPAVGCQQKSMDMSVARRLFTVAMSDFLCWFPIGLIGLLAAMGVPISDDVNVVTIIFVLPLNSAFNPILYTLSASTERKRIAKKERLRVFLSRQP